MGLQPVKGAIEAQLAGVWLKWNPKKWYCGKVGVFPQSVFTTMSSETQKGPNTPPCFHAFFCPAVCFPLTLLPCLHASCLWLNAQTSCPGEGHRESPDAWRCEDLFSVMIQSQSDTSFSPAGSRYRAKLVDQESQYAAGSWGVGVFFFCFFPTDDRWQLLSHSLVPCFSLSLSPFKSNFRWVKWKRQGM